MLKLVVFVAMSLLISSVLPAQIQIKISLSGNPSSVSIKKMNLKYGKYGAFCFVYDDRAFSAQDGFSIMPYYTDGTGKRIRCTATIASNGVNVYLQDADGMPIAKLKDFIVNNWGISCHGYIHTIPSSWTSQGYTVYNNVINNRKYHFDKLKALGTEYVLRTGIVPNADYGYELAWKQIGSLCGSSQNAYDTFPANPAADWVNSSVGDISNYGGKFQVFARALRNLIDQDATNELISKLGVLIQQSNASSNKLLVFGTHITNNSFFLQALDYLQNNSNDHIWVTSLHELMEYGETKDKTDVNYTISENIVTINLTQHLPDATRWRDISLEMVSNKSIVDLSYSGADSVSFNSLTGLINVFKKKTQGFLDPSIVDAPLPVRFISFSAKDGELQWKVAGNENLSHYEIEKSADGINFSIVASTKIEKYRVSSLMSNLFYRIKAVEKNDTYVYSTTIHISNSEKKSATIQRLGETIRVNFYSEKNGQADIKVFNSTGQLIYRINKKIDKGWNQANLRCQPLMGMYLIKLPTETIKCIN